MDSILYFGYTSWESYSWLLPNLQQRCRLRLPSMLLDEPFPVKKIDIGKGGRALSEHQDHP